MKIYRAFLPFLLTIFVSMAIFLSLAHFYPTMTAKETPHPKTMPILTPAEAARIAQDRFPDGQVQGIVLESAEDDHFYIVTINTPTHGAFEVLITLPSGQIHTITPLNTAPTTTLSLTELLQRIHDAYPAAQFAAITLQDQAADQLALCQAILWQDDTTITLTIQPIDGLILQEERIPHDTPIQNLDHASFAALLQQATKALPDEPCIGVTLLEDARYNAVYQDDTYRYELLLDSQGSELKRQIIPLDARTIQPVE